MKTAGVLIRAAMAAGIFLCCLALCACRSGEGEPQKERAQLELMVRKREDMESMRLLADAFNGAQEDAEVVLSFVPNVDTKLRIRAVEGELPDLIQVNGLQARECMEFVQGGYFLDLTGEPFMERVREELLSAVRYDGELPFFPLTLSYEGVYVNETLLEEAGYSVPKTYEELLALAEEISARGETAFLFPDRDDWTVRMCWENIETALAGTSAGTWDKVAKGEASFETDALTNTCLDRLLEIRRFGQEDALNTGYDEAVRAFANGQAYFFVQGSWCYQAMIGENPSLKASLIPFPAAQGEEQHAAFWLDSNLAVSAQSEHPEEAKAFLSFISEPERLLRYAEAQKAFGALQGTQSYTPPYAKELSKFLTEEQMCLEAVGLPGEAARFRDGNIRRLLTDGDGSARKEYLEAYTQKLLEYKEDYLEAEEKTG